MRRGVSRLFMLASIAVMLVAFAFVYFPLRNDSKAWELKVTEKQVQYDEAKEEYETVCTITEVSGLDNDAVQKTAREDLDYLLPDEIIFEITFLDTPVSGEEPSL